MSSSLYSREWCVVAARTTRRRRRNNLLISRIRQYLWDFTSPLRCPSFDFFRSFYAPHRLRFLFNVRSSAALFLAILPSKDAESTNLFIDGYFHIPITDAEYKGGLWAEPIKFGPSQVCQSELLMYGNMCVYRMSTTRKYIHGWKYHSYSIFDSEVAFSVLFFSLRSSMAEALNRRPRLFTTAAAHNNIKGTYWWLAYH